MASSMRRAPPQGPPHAREHVGGFSLAAWSTAGPPKTPHMLKRVSHVARTHAGWLTCSNVGADDATRGRGRVGFSAVMSLLSSRVSPLPSSVPRAGVVWARLARVSLAHALAAIFSRCSEPMGRTCVASSHVVFCDDSDGPVFKHFLPVPGCFCHLTPGTYTTKTESAQTSKT